ncbi:fork head domain-containing protein, partial [Dipodascopsis tothii]|uniref:fork head domain-containing protein n=1 Tax=Dipodascopsis tothii TaxID=44089 RepID=UPI0034CF1F61
MAQTASATTPQHGRAGGARGGAIGPSTGGPEQRRQASTTPGGSSSRISAYARLDFASFTFYVQTLQVIMGRRRADRRRRRGIDVHLGTAKAISRRHAKIFYNFANQRFEFSVLGRNGAFVDDTFIERGATVPLADGTRIQIGQIGFSFVLPSASNLEADSSGAGHRTIKPADAISLRESSAIPAISLAADARDEYAASPPAAARGMSLSDIYKAIQELFPYYQYAPYGWQNSVRHNLSLNKLFVKISKEGKGWLWGL